MTYTKQKVKLFQITGITANSIKHVTYKIPRELISIEGIQTMCFLAMGVPAKKLIPIECALLTLNLNDKAINPMQRYPVMGICNMSFRKNRKKYLPITVNETVKAGSFIHASLEDKGNSNLYPYTVTVYLYGTVEKELIP